MTTAAKKKTIITLGEKVDFDILRKLMVCDELDSKLKKELSMYFRKTIHTKEILIQYTYSKDCDEGRLYCRENIGLQFFPRHIRHALAREFYDDIDIANCHPVLLTQWCEKHEIPCPMLLQYVQKRETILTNMMAFYNKNRDAAKDMILRLLYGSSLPKKHTPYLAKLKEEFDHIGDCMMDINPDLYKKVETKKNAHGSLMSKQLQIIENECLMSMYNFFREAKIQVGVLVFDGLMIEKIKDDNLLRNCEVQVFIDTGYQIKLVKKPMDIPLEVKLPEHFTFVKNDDEAHSQLLKLIGPDKIKYCHQQLYIYNEENGLFEQDIEVLYQYIRKYKDYLKFLDTKGNSHSYADTARMMQNLVPLIKTSSLDNEWLENSDATSLGYLLFSDGIYNMKTCTFTPGFNHEIVFHYRINYPFPERNDADMDYVYNIFFKQMMKDPWPFIAMTARALTGYTSKNFVIGVGNKNSGKSKLVEAYKHTFGNYIGGFNAEVLVESPNNSADEASKLRWALLSRYKRILFSNEVRMNKKLDGNAIKKHSSGGDELTARQHCSNEIQFSPHYTIFCMLNDVPTIEPFDDAVRMRLSYQEFPYYFTKDVVNENDRLIDEQFNVKFHQSSFKSGLLHIILLANEMIQQHQFNPSFDTQFKNAWIEDEHDDNKVEEILNQAFVITFQPDDKISVAELKDYRLKHGITNMSNKKFNDTLRQLGLKEKATKKTRFWTGVRYRTQFD